jgi:hypothetical protein
MKRPLILIAMLATAACTPAFARGGSHSYSSYSSSGSHHVSGYTNSHGHFVQSYRATNPNHTKSDNWSTKGNYNPYTGKAGTKKAW